MFWTLLKIRAAGLVSSMFKGSKKGKQRGVGFKILVGILALYLILCFFMLFVMLFAVLCEPLCSQGLSWLYFGIALLFSMALSFVGSVFATQSQLFDAKDNELLLVMPVRPRAILASRMAVLMLLNFFYEALVILPAIVVYAVTRPINPLGMIFFAIGALAAPFFVMALSSLFAWLLSLVTARFRFKNIITLVLSIGFLAAYFLIYSQIQNYLNALIQNGAAVAEAVQKALFPVYHFGLAAAQGNVLNFLLFLASALLPFGLMYFILDRNFIRIVTAKRGGKKTVYKAGQLKVKSRRTALVARELRHFFSNAMYMLNAAIGVVLTLGAAVFFAVKKEDVMAMTSAIPGSSAWLPALACVVLCFCTAMNFVSAPSISLEGKNLWIIRSMPVKTGDILLAKAYAHFLVTAPATLIAAVIFCVFVKMNLAQGILLFVVPQLVNYFCGLLGVVVNLHFPKFDWVSETAAVKQGMSSTVAMFASMGIIAVPTILYIALLGRFLTAEWYLLLCAFLLAAFSLLMMQYCKTKGSRIFEGL